MESCFKKDFLGGGFFWRRLSFTDRGHKTTKWIEFQKKKKKKLQPEESSTFFIGSSII